MAIYPKQESDLGAEFLEAGYFNGAIRFERTELRSGRIAPYYVRVSRLVRDGEGLSKFKDFIVKVLEEYKFIHGGRMCFDAIFGPAYSGIALASQAVCGIYEQYGINLPWISNRKEVKEHGVDGGFLGETELLDGKRVLVVEDVITAGGTLQDTVRLLCNHGMTIAGVIVLFDREERGVEARALSEVEEIAGTPVHAVSTCSGLLQMLDDLGMNREADAIRSYREQYGFF